MGDSAGMNPVGNTGANIEDIVVRFERNIDAYRQGKYRKTLVRRDFIDPMFVALRWDINNHSGYTDAYRDVIHIPCRTALLTTSQVSRAALGGGETGVAEK